LLYNQEIEGLTPKEFGIIIYVIFKNPKQVFSREQLLTMIWGNYEYFGDERTVDAHIKKTPRQKN